MALRFGREVSSRICSVVARGLQLVVSGFFLCVTIAGASEFNPTQDAEIALEQARKAIEERQLDRAELQLERVLMLLPENAEAQVLLATLMTQVGRLDSALLLIKGLIDDPRTAEDYRQRLRHIYAQIVQTPRIASLARLPWRLASDEPDDQGYWRAEIGLGLSSNPLFRTSASELPLTINDSLLVLPLIDRPTKGGIVSASVARVGQASGFELNASSIKLQRGDPRTAETIRFAAWGPVVKSAYWQAQAQQSFDNQRRYTLGLSLLEGQHRLMAAAFAEPDRDNSGQLMRYEYRGMSALGGVWAGMLERGLNTTQTPDYWRVAVTGEFALGGLRFLSTNWSLQSDLSGYSPFFASNARRWIELRSVALEQHVAINRQKTLVFRGLATERRSNLALFSFRELGLQVSFVATWH